MDSKLATKHEAAELTDTMLDEVVGGGLLVDPRVLIAEGVTVATQAVTYTAAAIKEGIDLALGCGGVGPSARGRARGF